MRDAIKPWFSKSEIRRVGFGGLLCVLCWGATARAEPDAEELKKIPQAQLKLCEVELFKKHPHAETQLMPPTASKAADGKMIITLPFVETMSMDTRFEQFLCRFDDEKLIETR